MSDRSDARTLTGLSTSEAAARLAADGPNEIASQKPRNVLQIVWDVVKEPMLLLLVAAGSINLVISAVRPEENRVGEAMLLFAFVLVVIGITFYQERKTERALEALRDLSSPRALVVRDG
ncbi:MAG TPA: cation-transporting P-type ATPase, partial [Coriobacteriia bacterium]